MDSEFSNIPNWHGLQASDFDFDMDSYTVALRFLGDVSVGTPEDDALRIEGGTPEMRRSWESSRRFRRSLGKCREMGEQERAHAAQQQPDPFSGIPPRGGMDLAAETFDASTPKPPGALSRFLRRLGVEIDWQHAQRQEPRPPGQREISLDEMTDRDWAGVRYQGAEAQRVRAEQGLEGQKAIGRWTPPGVVWRVPGVQQWDGTGISPDGTRVEQ
jgi:hypothetical protein